LQDYSLLSSQEKGIEGVVPQKKWRSCMMIWFLKELFSQSHHN